jgi:hypothetical protein
MRPTSDADRDIARDILFIIHQRPYQKLQLRLAEAMNVESLSPWSRHRTWPILDAHMVQCRKLHPPFPGKTAGRQTEPLWRQLVDMHQYQQ